MSLRAHSGFTLIELLVALSIAVILLVLAVPLYSSWVADTQVANSASTMADGMRFAQAEAIKRNANIEFTVSGTGYTVRTVGGPALRTTVFKEASYFPTLARTPALSTTVTFNSLGTVELANAAAPTIPLTAVGVTMAQGSSPVYGLRVVVNNFGRVKVCDPDPKWVWPDDPKACPP